jgi:hypothetical protein
MYVFLFMHYVYVCAYVFVYVSTFISPPILNSLLLTLIITHSVYSFPFPIACVPFGLRQWLWESLLIG